MSFGTGDTAISRNTNHDAQVAEQIGGDGTVVGMTTYGAKKTTTERHYVDRASFENEAVNGQNGTEVVSAHNLIEVNTDYVQEEKTTVEALASGGTSA